MTGDSWIGASSQHADPSPDVESPETRRGRRDSSLAANGMNVAQRQTWRNDTSCGRTSRKHLRPVNGCVACFGGGPLSLPQKVPVALKSFWRTRLDRSSKHRERSFAQTDAPGNEPSGCLLRNGGCSP